MISSRVPVGFTLVGFALAVCFGAVATAFAASPIPLPNFNPPPPPPPPVSTTPPPPPIPAAIRPLPMPGDPPLPMQISDVLKHSSALNPSDMAQVDGVIGSVCTLMADAAHPANQSACRDWLVQGLSDSGQQPDSISYLQFYAKSVNAHLLALVSASDAGIRLKIEAGIVAAKVSDASMSTDLMPLAIQLMRDDSPAVALGGLKTAVAVLPAALDSPLVSGQVPAFANEIVATTIRNSAPPLGKRMANVAYQALEPIFRFPNLAPQITQTLVPAILDLEQKRLELYKKSPPAGPVEDANGMVGLFATKIWNGDNGQGGLTPAMKIQVLQTFSDLAGVTADWAINPDPAANASREDMLNSLRLLGNILSVFSDPTNGTDPDGSLYAAGLDLQNLGLSPAPSQLVNTRDTVLQGIATFGKKSGATINPPPLLDTGGN